MIILFYRLWQNTAMALQRRRRLALECRAFDALPPDLLRDPGLDHSEYGSCLTEAMGASKGTRRRLRTCNPAKAQATTKDGDACSPMPVGRRGKAG